MALSIRGILSPSHPQSVSPSVGPHRRMLSSQNEEDEHHELTFAEKQFAAPLAEMEQLRGEWEAHAANLVEENKRKDINDGSGGTRMIAFSTALVFLILGYALKGLEVENGNHGPTSADRTLEARLAAALPAVIEAHARKWNTGVQGA